MDDDRHIYGNYKNNKKIGTEANENYLPSIYNSNQASSVKIYNLESNSTRRSKLRAIRKNCWQ